MSDGRYSNVYSTCYAQSAGIAHGIRKGYLPKRSFSLATPQSMVPYNQDGGIVFATDGLIAKRRPYSNQTSSGAVQRFFTSTCMPQNCNPSNEFTAWGCPNRGGST